MIDTGLAKLGIEILLARVSGAKAGVRCTGHYATPLFHLFQYETSDRLR